jgi:hypothetical protein
VFFVLNTIAQPDEWDVELPLITDHIEALADDLRAIIKKLCDREERIRFSRGITSEVALYTKSGGFASGSRKKVTGKSDARKDKKGKPVCPYCNKNGHLEEKCCAEHGATDSKVKDKAKNKKKRKDKEDNDKKGATANLTTTSTSDTLWMVHADGNHQVDPVMNAAGPSPSGLRLSIEADRASWIATVLLVLEWLLAYG